MKKAANTDPNTKKWSINGWNTPDEARAIRMLFTYCRHLQGFSLAI